jgi:hypothetical protein
MSDKLHLTILTTIEESFKLRSTYEKMVKMPPAAKLGEGEKELAW